VSQLRVPFTRMNLLRFKRSLKIAESGREILEKKRDILMVELRNFAYDMQRTREELGNALREAVSYIEKAAVSLGSETVERNVESTATFMNFLVDYRSVMGVTVPIVKLGGDMPQPDYGFLGTNIYLDVAYRKFHELMTLLCRLTELEESVHRIASAVEATQRRVNALKQVHIPRYRRIVKEIEAVLEEREREEFVRMKKVKNIIEKRRVHNVGKR
jgi:V/A-type H+-transporting ATPase subunit D